MAKEEKTNVKLKMKKDGSGGNLVYCLGLLGALVYYIQVADTFWAGLVGVLKAFLWPAFLTYELLKSLGA